MKKFYEHEARVRFSHQRSGADSETPFVLEVVDSKSHSAGLTVYLTADQVAEMVVGNCEADAEVKWAFMGNLGRRAENKQEFVPILGDVDWDERDEQREKSLAPFCVDGWHPRGGDFGNPHCWGKMDGVEGYYVVFFRNVQDDDGWSDEEKLR